MQDNLSNTNGHTKSNPNLYHLTVKAGFWVFALRILMQVLSYARYIILLRILPVADVGLLGVAMLLMQTLNSFTNTGFQAALIQKKENIHAYLNSAWTVGIIRAIVLFVIFYLAAPYAAMLGVPDEKVSLTIDIIRVTGLVMIIMAFCNIGTIYFQKELRFNKLFIYQLGGTLTDCIVTICIVLVYKTIWSLVIGKLVGTSVMCLLSYIMSPYRPALSLDLAKARELWKFGKWILGGTILSFLMTQGDDFFVWGMLGVSSLALYQIAYKFSCMPATEITNVISQVTFPAYSKLQDDIPRLRDAYLKVLQLTAFLSVPVAGLIFILAPDFVRLFLKPKWLPMVPAMQILAIFGLLRSLGATRGPVFRAVGKLRIVTKLQSIKLVVLVILIYFLTKRFDIAGTALAVTLANVTGQYLGIYFIIKCTKAGVWEMLKPMLFPLAATVVMLAVMTTFRNKLPESITFAPFFVLAIIGTATYIATVLVCDKFFGYGIVRNLRKQLKTLTK